jgi:hypothetical protein
VYLLKGLYKRRRIPWEGGRRRFVHTACAPLLEREPQLKLGGGDPA